MNRNIVYEVEAKHKNSKNVIIFKELLDKIKKQETKLDTETLILFGSLITGLNLSHKNRDENTTNDFLYNRSKELFLPQEFLKEMHQTQYNKYLNWFINNKLLELTEEYSYTQGQARQYKLLIPNDNKNIRTYILKEKKSIKIYFRMLSKKYEKIADNYLAIQYYNSIRQITLPTIEELTEYAKYLHKNKIKVNGKGFRFDRNRSKKDSREDTYYVKDNIEQYERLFLLDKFYIPFIKANRFYSPFNFLPRWIKEYMCSKCFDFRCLHPNLIQNIYKYETEQKDKFITHDKIAEYLNISRVKVKIAHLSYFNMTAQQRYGSPINKYYSAQGDLTNRIFKDQKENGQNIVALRLFEKETLLMETICKQLYDLNIPVQPNFDELCGVYEEHNEIIEAVMNIVADQLGVYTNVSDKSIEECTAIVLNYIENEMNKTTFVDYDDYNESNHKSTLNDTKSISNTNTQEIEESSLNGAETALNEVSTNKPLFDIEEIEKRDHLLELEKQISEKIKEKYGYAISSNAAIRKNMKILAHLFNDKIIKQNDDLFEVIRMINEEKEKLNKKKIVWL